MVPLSLKALATHEDKFEEKMRAGIWLGTVERTDEYIIGTPEGVIKCGTI